MSQEPLYSKIRKRLQDWLLPLIGILMAEANQLSGLTLPSVSFLLFVISFALAYRAVWHYNRDLQSWKLQAVRIGTAVGLLGATVLLWHQLIRNQKPEAHGYVKVVLPPKGVVRPRVALHNTGPETLRDVTVHLQPADLTPEDAKKYYGGKVEQSVRMGNLPPDGTIALTSLKLETSLDVIREYLVKIHAHNGVAEERLRIRPSPSAPGTLEASYTVTRAGNQLMKEDWQPLKELPHSPDIKSIPEPLRTEEFLLYVCVNSYDLTQNHLKKAPKEVTINGKNGPSSFKATLQRKETLDWNRNRGRPQPKICYTATDLQIPNIGLLDQPGDPGSVLRFPMPYELQTLTGKETSCNADLYVRTVWYPQGIKPCSEGIEIAW